ncbi:MAG TPA: hypothetical protein DCR23_02805 [Ruminococcaceae bacterium]|nr:hypothetical protein [Oscillospiraceae bacterium]
MATISFIRRKDSGNVGSLGSVIQYSFQEEKTEYDNGRLVSGINCLPETALKDFVSTKERFNKTEGRQYYYAIQSFKDADIDPVLAHTLAREWAERCYPDHEIVIATHLDTDNIHSHIIINSVNCVNGKKIHQNGDDIKQMRSVNDELCMKYGLPVCPAKPKEKIKPTKAGEYYSARNGSSWKRNMIIAIVSAMKKSGSKEEFIKEMKRKGYEVKWSDSRKNITFIESDNPKHRCRDDNLHYEKFLKENISNEFEIRRSYMEHGEQMQPGAGLHLEHGRRTVGDDSGQRQMGRADQSSEVPEPGNGRFGEGCASYTGRGKSEPDSRLDKISADSAVGGVRNIPRGNSDLGGRGNEQEAAGSGEGTVRTGWEAERTVYFVHVGLGQHNKKVQKKTHRSSVRRADNNQFTIPAVVHLAGTFAEMIDYAQRKKKEDDEESSYVQSM